MTTIEVAINGTPVFIERHNRRLGYRRIRRIVAEGCLGIDRTLATVSIKIE